MSEQFTCIKIVENRKCTAKLQHPHDEIEKIQRCYTLYIYM